MEDGCNLFILLFTLCVGVGMVWFFRWLARVSENLPENAVLNEPTTNEIEDDEDGSIRMSHIGAAIIAANSEFPSSNVASSSTSIRDPIEMPVLRDEGDLPEPYTAWSPEAMLTFMPLCIQGVRAENPQQLRWNDSNCMKSDFNCFAT